MRIQISSISLVGAEREYSFAPGLNIITGPIATGKTTLLRLIRGVLGSGFQDFPREATENISNIACELWLGDGNYQIVRPFVSTNTAKVDIAGKEETLRLPALQPTSAQDLTYGRWLLEKLDLPVLEVPTAPTRNDSDFSPVSINDFLLYCYLRQNEIDNSVYGHDNPFKNIKRKYVFEITYGKYNVELAKLHEELRDATRELTRLRGKAKTIEEFLTDTPFENKAKLQFSIDDFEKQLQEIENQTKENIQKSQENQETILIRERIQNEDGEISKLESRRLFEISSEKQLRELLSQLETQSNRLTRSIVAGKYLLDFDFVICPRCGSDLQSDRTSEATCYVCLQHPEPKLARQDLISEQNRLENQINETRELIEVHGNSVELINAEILRIKDERSELSSELNFLTDSYISDRASNIASTARKRTELQEGIIRFNDYLQLFDKREISQSKITKLETKQKELQAEIDSIISSETGIEDRIKILETKFIEILEKFDAPTFIESGVTGIDRGTFLPIFEGRRFNELQSQGLKVIVNVAHALAHQLVAIDQNLLLPNILLIDGITANIGHEGLDWERVEKIFDYLNLVSETYGDKLQLIVAENTVPEMSKEKIRVNLSDEDKLIPSKLLSESK